MAKRNRGGAGARPTAGTASGQARRKRRQRPPWGNILGGKLIKRHAYVSGQKIDLGETFARQMQHIKMLSFMSHYGIVGQVPAFPIAGVGDVGWLSWYQLALAIASELDDSLKIVDAKPQGKTAPRWRGADGLVLLSSVDGLRQIRPNRPIRWCLLRLQKVHPKIYGHMPLDQLEARYYEAKRHHRTTKRARNSKRAS
jgi:hypothetical protein